MSRLDELIAELCPDGVEYKRIGEIATDIFRGSGIKREDVTEDGIPCVRYGEIYTTYGIWFNECVSHTHIDKVQSPKFFEYGDILFVITGESVEDIAKSTAYIGHEKCLAGGDIVVLKHNQDPKYLSYALATMDAQKQKSAGKVKSKVVHSSVPSISSIIVPVPPLPVQREIVRILDNFTELTAKLTTELTAELTARQKQYEYYRQLLFSRSRDTQTFSLDELCATITDGSHFSPKETETGYYMPSVKDMTANGFDYSQCKKISKADYEALVRNGCNPKRNDVLVAKDGATMLKHAFVVDNEEEIVILSSIAIFRPNMKLIEPRFMAHYFRQKTFKEKVIREQSTKGGVPRIVLKNFKKIKLHVPSIKKQKEIIIILDRFDSLCNDITTGLPAEIAARQKQYEYYRDKLLSFTKKQLSQPEKS